jgi:protoheme IX farnesyltransferase
VGRLRHLARQYAALTKPRVTQLAVFCAIIGMFLATPGMVPWSVLIGGAAGIWLLAGAAFAINCLVEQKIDALMRRTAWRPSATGEITTTQTLIFSAVLGGAGMWLLHVFANDLTMWLTFATFLGYAVVYTILLKPATPQNIVIGGLSGAMPPALGWAAVSGTVPAEAWFLVLIIFTWTPPHFWALALYRRADYAKSGLPMLPITHGERYTLLHILLYTLIMIAATLLPFVYGMSGYIYLVAALGLGLVFRLRLEAVPQLLGRSGPAHLPLFDPVPVAAVCGAAGGSLLQVRAAGLTACGILPRPEVIAGPIGDTFEPPNSCACRPLPRPLGRIPPLCLLALCTALLAACGQPSRRSERRYLGRHRFGKDFALLDPTGKTRTLADFKGKVVLMFFGYTHCPDVCPTTMVELKQVMEQMGPDADKVQVLFVTVDPERDTAALMAQYVPAFDRASWACARPTRPRSRR